MLASTILTLIATLLLLVRESALASPWTKTKPTPSTKYNKRIASLQVNRQKLATRRRIVAARQARKVAGVARQATTSCPVYPTCSPSFHTGTRFCEIPGYDFRNTNDLARSKEYSLEQCVARCESTSGCDAVVWTPTNTNVEGSSPNCYLKDSTWTSASLTPQRSDYPTYLTLMGPCCEYNDRLTTGAKAVACNDDGQGFTFPTCTGADRLYGGNAVFRGMDLRAADVKGYPVGTSGSTDGSQIVAANRVECIAACDSFASCVGMVYNPNAAAGAVNCYFKDDNYRTARADQTKPTSGFTNNTNLEFIIDNTACGSQVGTLPNSVLFFCCDDFQKSYPTCTGSTRDGTAFYAGYDNNGNDFNAYGPNKANGANASSRAQCNQLCRNIGAGCVGTTYTGGTGTNCYFKTNQILSKGALRNQGYTNGGGASFVGGCSQYSTLVGSSLDAICCNNN